MTDNKPKVSSAEKLPTLQMYEFGVRAEQARHNAGEQLPMWLYMLLVSRDLPSLSLLSQARPATPRCQ